MSVFLNFTIYNDSPEPWAIGFQDGVSPGFTGIVELHDNIFFYLVVIAILVFWMLGSTIYYFNYDKTKIVHKYLVHGTLIEVLWTIFPAIVLLAIAIPSFRLLYILDEVTLPTITVKVTGHQWYWSYEYSDYETESGDPIEFDSYMIPDSDLEIGQSRLLEVDNPIVLPENTHVRFIVTSTDVLHDFAIPSAGIKIDATPGRLNQASFYSERAGELFGQCSELCGTYHGYMPIQVEVGAVEDYLSWISSLVLLIMGSTKKILNLNQDKSIYTKNNSNFCNELHTTAVLSTSNEDLIRRALQNDLNMDQELDRLALVKFQDPQQNIKDLGIQTTSNTSTGFEESFPWFVLDGKTLDYNQEVKLEEGINMANKFIALKLNVPEDQISKVKIAEILQHFIETKNPSIWELYQHILNETELKFFKESSMIEVSNTSASEGPASVEDLKEVTKSLGKFGDMTINDLYLKLKDFKLPLGDVQVHLDMFKVIPTVYIYRGIVNAYINSAYPLSEINKMDAKTQAERLFQRGKATRLWAAYFAPIATVTILTFIQRGFPLSIEIGSTLKSFLPNYFPSLGEVNDKEGITSVKNAFLSLFLSNKLKTLSCNLKSMSTGQLFKFIFKTLSKILLILILVYYFVDPSIALSYLANLSLYDLAKIWLVGNIYALLYFISSFIAYIYYCKLLDKGVKEENVRISIYWPTFIAKQWKSLLILSTGPEEFKKKWINQYWLNIFIYSCSVSFLSYFIWA